LQKCATAFHRIREPTGTVFILGERQVDFGLKDNSDSGDPVFDVVRLHGVEVPTGGEGIGAVERIGAGNLGTRGGGEARFFEVKDNLGIDRGEARAETRGGLPRPNAGRPW